MKISVPRLELAMARSGKARAEYRDALTPGTYARIRRGEQVHPSTLGKIAKALNVDPAEIVLEEGE